MPPQIVGAVARWEGPRIATSGIICRGGNELDNSESGQGWGGWIRAGFGPACRVQRTTHAKHKNVVFSETLPLSDVPMGARSCNSAHILVGSVCFAPLRDYATIPSNIVDIVNNHR